MRDRHAAGLVAFRPTGGGAPIASGHTVNRRKGPTTVAASDPDRAANRDRRLLWAGILALIGLVLLFLGLTVADGATAWIEVAVAIGLLLTSYGLQRVARRQTLYRDRS